MKIKLDELITLQSALVNAKLFLSGGRKMDQEILAILVEMLTVVMKKLIAQNNRFSLKFIKLSHP